MLLVFRGVGQLGDRKVLPPPYILFSAFSLQFCLYVTRIGREAPGLSTLGEDSQQFIQIYSRQLFLLEYFPPLETALLYCGHRYILDSVCYSYSVSRQRIARISRLMYKQIFYRPVNFVMYSDTTFLITSTSNFNFCYLRIISFLIYSISYCPHLEYLYPQFLG